MGVALPAYALTITLLLAGLSSAQDCLILKRMGPADQITSHMYSFGIRGKQFQYVEGPLPKGIKFHGRLTDHDVRKIQDAGGRFVVLEPKFTGADLSEARKGCIANYGQTSSEKAEASNAAPPPSATNNQGSAKGPDSAVTRTAPNPPTQSAAPQPSIRPAVLVRPVAATQAASSGAPDPGEGVNDAVAASAAPASVDEGAGIASVTSNPDGAEIFVDSVGRGHAPSLLKLQAGKHRIQLVANGYKDWFSDVDVKSGSIVNVTASLGK